ncbi:MAG: type IV pilus biogenesis/stability protein PilW [Bacteriovorax sp.]|nr:type IV pilus biogenesis/stability protein PilW [Rhizobacter sp.]
MMSAAYRLASAGSAMAAIAVLACLAGCAARVSSTGPSGDTKDLVTASDESDGSKRARVRMELASGYFERGQMTTALDQVKLAIAADSSFSEAFNLRGLIYANIGDERLAEESFRRALQLNPRDADTMQNFGYFLCQKKRYVEATALFDQALALPQYRNAGRTLLTKGVCLSLSSQWADAEVSLLRAYELEPTNPAVAVNLSEVLYKRGDFERARFYVRRVNAVPAIASAQTLWLAARIENGIGNRAGVQEFGDQLRRRFPDSREFESFQRGNFDE